MTDISTEPGNQGDQHSEPAPEGPQQAATLAVEPAKTSAMRNPRVRIGAVVALAVAAGVIAWAIVGRSTNSKTNTTPASGPVVKSIGPVALSAARLRSEASTIGQPIYWAGAKSGYIYEFTRTTSNKLYVRYLPKGVKAGAKGARYLIVATYPDTNAYRGLLAVSKGQQVAIPGGGIALVDVNYPKSVHLAYPGVAYQIEVYDPSPTRALHTATSGNVSPAG